jgi:hypothetical protein
MCDDHVERRLVGDRFARADDGEEADGEILESGHEVGEEEERRRVAPLEIVDGEEQRTVLGEVRRQPVEAMEDGEAILRPDRWDGGRIDEVTGEPGRAREDGLGILEPGQRRLEQLPHDPERVVDLELGGPRPQTQHAGGERSLTHDIEQSALANPGGTLDDSHAAAPPARLTEQHVELIELRFSLE